MDRRGFLKLAVGAGLGMAAWPRQARACKGRGFMHISVPLPERVALADLVAVGKVQAIEPRNLVALPASGDSQGIEYQVAVLKLDQVLGGVQGLSHARLAFQPNALQYFEDERLEKAAAMPFRGSAQAFLAVGFDACFFLHGTFGHSYFQAPGYQDIVPREGNTNFDKELDLIKKCVKLLAEPLASLRSKDASDRLLAAAMLVTAYRTPKSSYGPEPIQEAIDVEQSRLIVQAIADADWNNVDPQTQLNPAQVFQRLALTEREGWRLPPQGFRAQQEHADHVKQWLKGPGANYRMLRFLPNKKHEVALR
jgi:hypothetical protein